jgi:hypothetical protein
MTTKAEDCVWDEDEGSDSFEYWRGEAKQFAENSDYWRGETGKRDAEIERLRGENQTLHNLKMLQESQFRYDIERLKEEAGLLRSLAESRKEELDEQDAKIERLRSVLEALRYEHPIGLSGKAFDIIEDALK